MIAIMLPNIIYAVKCKEKFENRWKHKAAEMVEQIGRMGCFFFMIFYFEGTGYGWRSDEAFAVYFVVDVLLIVLYLVMWAVFWKKNTVAKALVLSIIPSVLFLFSGIMSHSVLLIIAALLFAPCHILISYKNVE